MIPKHFQKNILLFVILFLFVIFTTARLFFLKNPGIDGHNGLFWAMAYNVVAIWGGICGLYLSKLWGGHKSIIGRVSLAFALGLFAQAFGQNVYNYFYITQGFDIAVPYPSIGDIGYFGSVLAYIYGVLLLAKASGVKISLKSFGSKISAIVIPLIMLVLSYWFFLRGYSFDWNHPVKVFLDFGYPFGQAVYVSFAILTLLLSRKFLGGIMRVPIIYFLVALIVQYLCDFTFLYQANEGTFVAGGIVDFMYFISYFIMSLSLIRLGSAFEKIKNS